MTLRSSLLAIVLAALAAAPFIVQEQNGVPNNGTASAPPNPLTVKHATSHGLHPDFRTSDRCEACHNGMKTFAGDDYSIGVDWRASIMANSGRDPYWQGSIRRESIDHASASADVQNDCSICHMPLLHLEDRQRAELTKVFANFPLQKFPHGNLSAADGVTCSVCHQVEPTGLGTHATFNGQVDVAAASATHIRPEYGPYDTDLAHQNIMMSSTGGFQPLHGDQIRDPGLCGSCHTLYTDALGPGGKKVGTLPEQMPFLEWQHSDFSHTSDAHYQTCQDCHMPEVPGTTPITRLYGPQRARARRHVFVGANFLIEGILGDHHDELAVEAKPSELAAAEKRTKVFLQTRAARVFISDVHTSGGELQFDVTAQNLSGHKLPTAFPSRRAWLHVTVRDVNGNIIFESGHLNPDGSIRGNANDEDPTRYEPHYSEITSSNQVEIFEDILHDMNDKVTTGILAGTGYLKDNRLLPAGFDKESATHDIAVVGKAAQDPNFTGGHSTTLYRIPLSRSSGPLHIEAELIYQPIGFRWLHNLEPYKAPEPQRMVRYYDQHSHDSALVLAHANWGR